MQWLLLAVIAVSLIYLSRYFPKVAFSILGALVVGAAIIVLTTTDLGDVTRGQLPVEDIIIENPVMIASYHGSYRFSARITNKNEETGLRESVVSITMLDCDDRETSGCRIIGQEEKRFAMPIPPLQSRDVSHTISFNSAKPTGDVRWEFRITRTRS